MYDRTNQKAVGKFKSEETFEITDLCGLKPTCEAYKVFTGEEFEEHKKTQGLMRNKQKKDIHVNKYYERTVNEHIEETTTFDAIRSKNHQLYSISQTKIALTSLCSKRCWTDAIHSVPYGHVVYLIDLLSLKS